MRGIGHPSVFHHPTRGLVTLVHGDDYTTAGSVTGLLWFKKRWEETYEIKTQLLGPEGAETSKVRNRIITFTGMDLSSKLIHDTVK